MDSLRKDFEIFSKGIKRLEELRSELDSMNTRGFEAEANSIRSRLKNVSEIPNIERDLKKLKAKISGKYKPKQRKNHIEGKIKELEAQLDRKTKVCRSDSRVLAEIPRIKAQLSELKKELNNQKDEERRKEELLKRIDPAVDLISNDVFDKSLNEIKLELSDRIKNREAEIQKSLDEDLKIREENFKVKYLDLEKAYHEAYDRKVKTQLREEVEKKFKKLLDEALAQRKARLSDQEIAILRARAEKDFEKRKDEIKKEFETKLAEVKAQMRRHFNEELMVHKEEMHRKFEKEIAEQVSALRYRYGIKQQLLDQKVKRINAQKDLEVRKKEEEIQRILSEKQKRIEQRLNLEVQKRLNEENQKNRILNHLNEEKRRLEELKRNFKSAGEGQRKKIVEEDRKKIDAERRANEKLLERITNLRKNYLESLGQKNSVVKSEEQIKRELSSERTRYKRLLNKLSAIQQKYKRKLSSANLAAKKEKQEINDLEKDMRQKFEQEKNEEIRAALKMKTGEISKELKKEYEHRLQVELKKKEIELEKQRIVFEEEMRRKAQSLFNK